MSSQALAIRETKALASPPVPNPHVTGSNLPSSPISCQTSSSKASKIAASIFASTLASGVVGAAGSVGVVLVAPAILASLPVWALAAAISGSCALIALSTIALLAVYIASRGHNSPPAQQPLAATDLKGSARSSQSGEVSTLRRNTHPLVSTLSSDDSGFSTDSDRKRSSSCSSASSNEFHKTDSPKKERTPSTSSLSDGNGIGSTNKKRTPSSSSGDSDYVTDSEDVYYDASEDVYYDEYLSSNRLGASSSLKIGVKNNNRLNLTLLPSSEYNEAVGEAIINYLEVYDQDAESCITQLSKKLSVELGDRQGTLAKIRTLLMSVMFKERNSYINYLTENLEQNLKQLKSKREDISPEELAAESLQELTKRYNGEKDKLGRSHQSEIEKEVYSFLMEGGTFEAQARNLRMFRNDFWTRIDGARWLSSTSNSEISEDKPHEVLDNFESELGSSSGRSTPTVDSSDDSGVPKTDSDSEVIGPPSKRESGLAALNIEFKDNKFQVTIRPSASEQEKESMGAVQTFLDKLLPDWDKDIDLIMRYFSANVITEKGVWGNIKGGVSKCLGALGSFVSIMRVLADYYGGRIAKNKELYATYLTEQMKSKGKLEADLSPTEFANSTLCNLTSNYIKETLAKKGFSELAPIMEVRINKLRLLPTKEALKYRSGHEKSLQGFLEDYALDIRGPIEAWRVVRKS